jgi:hypothetical protein
MRLKEDDDSRYINNGYKDRGDYLKNLADDYGIDSMIVNELAGMLGPNEDFDGLVTELEDSYNAGLLDDFRKEVPQETQNPCEHCTTPKGTCDGCIENGDTNFHEEGINPWGGQRSEPHDR